MARREPDPVWIAHVDAGGKLTIDLRERFLAHARTFAGQRVELILRKPKTQRSLAQNRWLWGVALPLLAEHLGYDRHEHERLHYALLETCFGREYDARLGVDVLRTTSSQLTTAAFADYMEWLTRFAAEHGVYLPLPGETA